MTTNNIKSRVSVLESQYKEFYKRFNEEVGEIRDILKGKGTEQGLVDEVRNIRNEQKRLGMRVATWVSIVTAGVLIIFQFVLPRVFGL